MSLLSKIKCFFQSHFSKRKQIEAKSQTNLVTMQSLQDFIQQQKQQDVVNNESRIAVRVSDGDGLGIQGGISE